MKTLDRYLGSQFLKGFSLLLFALTTLFSFVELVGELDEVGEGTYRLVDAFAYVGLMTPRTMLDLVPVSALLGSVVAIGVLADGHELIAMRACGLSVRRICWSVLGSGAALMVVALAWAEFVTPPLEQSARVLRSRAQAAPGTYLSGSGFWARDGQDLIRVGRVSDTGTPREVGIYERDEDGRLVRFTRAGWAEVGDRGEWLLKDVQRWHVDPEGIVTTRHRDELRWRSPLLRPEEIGVLRLPPESLSLSDLYLYVGSLTTRGENAENYALALWQKLCLPLTTGAMVLLSLPFVFGPQRSRSAGKRIAAGALVGIAYFVVSRVLAHLGLVLDLHPALGTLGPAALVAAAALWLLRGVP